MRGSRRKSIERYVDQNFPMLSQENMYRTLPSGEVRLHPACRRGVVQNIKRNWTKRRTTTNA